MKERLNLPTIEAKPRITLEQRHLEHWDNVMCAGRVYELSDQVEQIDTRLWENALPEEDYE